MNARKAIQPSNQAAVLSVAFSASRSRFITGLSDGFRCFRTDNCLTTYQPSQPSDGGIAIAEALDDRYQAYVGGGRAPAGKGSVVVFWDALLGFEVNRFDFHEDVLGVRLSGKYMVVLLHERTIVFEHQQLESSSLPTPPPDAADDVERSEASAEVLQGPNLVKALYSTSPNTYALASLTSDLLALPAQTVGQVQLIPLQGGSKRVLRAHNSSLRYLALSDDSTLLATASEQGTLVRVFNTRTTDQVAEFRRGVDHAIVFGLAFSAGNRWLACTSDKGTLHIFDLRPPDPATVAAEQERQAKDRRQQQHRRSQNYATHRLSGGTTYDNTSTLSGGGGGSGGGNLSLGRSSPASAAGTGYQGSVQEYYGLRPVPTSASPPTGGAGISAMAALKASPWAPKVLKDVRSVASAPFYMGEDGPYWQGGAGYSWTTTPKGVRKRVRNAVAALPGNPTGRPPKGVLAFMSRPKTMLPGTGRAGNDDADGGDDEGAVMYVIGGGSDARWEQFALLPTESGGWVVVNKGFRKYLTRQFVD